MALAWNAGWVNALRGSNPLSSAAESLWSALCRPQALFFVAGTPSRFQVRVQEDPGSGCLAHRTPEEVPAGDRVRQNRAAADPAGLILPPVDVDLTAVVVLPRGSAHGLGFVLGSAGVDAAALPTDPHEFNSVLPARLGTFPTERSARCERIDAEAEEDFRTIDVAGAGDDRLVHEQGGDRRPGPQDPVDEFLRIRIGSQRVGTEPVDDGGDLGGVEERAGVGSAQIDRAHTVGDTPADLPDDLGFAFGQPHRAVDAQMDVDPRSEERRVGKECRARGAGARGRNSKASAWRERSTL